MSHESHTVVCHKLTRKGERSGEVKVLFEKIDGDFSRVNREKMFCQSEKVFVTTSYEEIDNKYNSGELFVLETTGESNSGECTYISIGSKATKLPPKDIIEVIKAKLPEVSNRKINAFSYQPSTKYIFIEDDFLYGPFEYEIEENLAGGFYLTLNTLAITLINKGVPNGYICKTKPTKEVFTETVINEKRRKFILNIEELNDMEVESYDYRNDEIIIQDGNKILKRIGKEFTKSEIRDLKNDVLNSPDLSQFDKDTINRFFPFLDRMEEWSRISNEMIQKYFESVQGRKYLELYIEKNKDIYFENKIDEQKEKIETVIKDLKNEEDSLRERIEDLEKTRDSIAIEVRAKKEQLANVKPDESIIAISEEYKQKENELSQVKSDIESLKHEHSNLQKIVDLEKHKERIVWAIEEKQKEQAKLEDAHKKLKAQVAGDEDDIKKKLLEYKTYIDIIYTAKNDNKIIKDYSIKVCQKEKNDSKAREDYINYIYNFFLTNGRDYKKDEIVNLVVSIQQSFITVLAGLPGVGKTSLVQYLGKALGLNNRLLNISVARGWTSQRDLLGYFNPLNNTFQSAPTGLYELLQATSKENQNSPQAPTYVLLDEANLSPIEHYWSTFMIMTDDNNEKKLQTGRYGDDAEIIIPDALRFIATINYDSTTENLSPRLIDRTPIIKLRPERINQSKIKQQIDTDFLVYSHQELTNLFDVPAKERPELSENEIEHFSKIIDVLQDENPDYGQPIIVSQRKQISIARYCHIARDNMIEEGNLRALDYAISQHILPLINGSGEQYGERLSKLLERIPKNHFKISYPQLERIIKIGKAEIDTFNFFV